MTTSLRSTPPRGGLPAGPRCRTSTGRLPRRGFAAGLLALPLLGLALLAAPPVTAQEESACEPWIELQGETPRLRAHLDAFAACQIDEPTYARLLGDFLRPAGGLAPKPAVIALGRAEEFPWLSRALAAAALADPRWNASRGKPRGEDIYAFVTRLLMADAIRARLQTPLADAGLVITDVSVEKVLVRRVGDVLPDADAPSRRVPVDAQVWLHLAPAAGE